MSYERAFSRSAQRMRESPIRRMGALAARVPDLVSFAPGYPDDSMFPWEAFRTIAADVLSGADGNALQYGATRGYRPLVDLLETILDTRGISSTFEERLVTSGSQQGLDLLARVLLDPGDVVLMELPTYTGAISAFINAQAELVGIPQDADGVSLAALDETYLQLTAAGRRVKFLYVVPNFQNPTGLLIGLRKRQELLAWSAQRDVILVEDDPYGDLYFPDTTSPAETRPIKADDDAGRVVYLGSFSKTLAPGFRVAWLVGPAPLVAKMEIAKQSADICSGALDQRIVHRAVRDGVVSAQAEALRLHYQAKRTVMQEALARELAGEVSCAPPRGGFFLWATLKGGLDAQIVLEHAIAAGVTFVIGSAFFVNGQGHDTLRLSFSQPATARLAEGVARLAVGIRAARAAGPQDDGEAVGRRLNGISSPRG